MFYCLKFDFGSGILQVYTNNGTNGQLRKLSLTYSHKNEPLMPSATWYEQVEAEIQYQLQEELAQAKGQRIPGY